MRWLRAVGMEDYQIESTLQEMHGIVEFWEYLSIQMYLTYRLMDFDFASWVLFVTGGPDKTPATTPRGSNIPNLPRLTLLQNEEGPAPPSPANAMEAWGHVSAALQQERVLHSSQSSKPPPT